MNTAITPFLFGTMLLAAGCTTDPQMGYITTDMPAVRGGDHAVHEGAETTPQLPGSEAMRKQRDDDRRIYLQTKAVAEDLLNQGRHDKAADEYWKAAIKNPRACKSLLVDFYCSRKSTRTSSAPSKYANRYLKDLADVICPKSEATQLEFPCFAIVAPDRMIHDKIQEWWCCRDSDDIEQAILFAQRRVKIKDGLFVRELKTEAGASIPVLSEKEARNLFGDIRSAVISEWKLCLLDKNSVGKEKWFMRILRMTHIWYCANANSN